MQHEGLKQLILKRILFYKHQKGPKENILKPKANFKTKKLQKEK